ncbi:MAG: PilT/PilU family type 4a pilus ATPase [Patescibacteria group bacterium]
MPKLNATQLLEKVIDLKASDLHLSVGAEPHVRINTVLGQLEGYEVLSTDDIEYILSQVLDTKQREILDVNKELDFSIALGQKARFRVNAYFQKGYPAIAFRYIPIEIPSFEALNLPEGLLNLCNIKQGLILVVGPAGHGKSTTIAAMLDKINQTRAEHIITIEDPIEYIFSDKKSLVEQREMYLDTHSWEVALKSVLRQDPNIVFVGEVRDAETIKTVLQIAETGHLVFTTLHTNSAAQTIDRMISSFSAEKQSEIGAQLAQVIEVIISERLIPSQEHGVVPAFEIMVGTDAISNLIREGKAHMIDNVISTSAQLGMISLEKSMAELVKEGKIAFEDAIKFTERPNELKRLIDKS